MRYNNMALQDMIATVVQTATEKLASDHGVKQAMEEDVCSDCGHEGCPAKCPEGCGCATSSEKTAGLTDPTYISKLASACDFIASNVENISPPNRGVLGQAIAKMAGESVPPVYPSQGSLEVTTGMSGEQKYKKDKPKGEDAAASQANTPLTAGGLPGGATQVSNDMNSAPGQNSGSVPKAEYPADGPLHAGSSKTAHKLLKSAQASAARQRILQKLAGEDVMSASISSSKSGGPLVGDGEMKAHDSEEVPKNPTDGSGYGNPLRRLIQSNDAAQNYTKGDAKKPQASQLKEVLDEPAMSPATDSKLREQLRNTGEAGVKIAGAQARALLVKAAQEGRLNQETVDQFKKQAGFANGQASGYASGAPTPPNPAGGKMAGEGEEDPASKLKALMLAQKAKESGTGVY